MNKSLLSGGSHYDLLINWDKRLKNEVPFLLDFFSDRLTSESSILSVGCGTGRHLGELSKSYQSSLLGIDLDPTMIAKARMLFPKAEFIVGDFLDPKMIQERTFDAIYSLGNSVGLIAASITSYKPIIKKFSSILEPGGILVFQLLNTMKERNGWSPPRNIQTVDGEYIFLRGFTTTPNFIQPEIVTLFRASSDSDFELMTTGKTNIPRITIHKMKQLLEDAGFIEIALYGDYHKKSFYESSSQDMIFACRQAR